MKTPTAGHRRTPTQTVPTQPKGKFSKVLKLNEVIPSLNSTCFCITKFGLSAIIQTISVCGTADLACRSR